MPGSSILVKHEPTGYVSGTTSHSKGLFVMPNLKPGGPYTITISFVGFQTEKNENVKLWLGNNPDAGIELKHDDKSLQEEGVTGSKSSGYAGVSVSIAQMKAWHTL